MLTRCVATKKQKANFLAKHCERKDSISYVKKDSIVYKDSLIYIPQIINTPIYLENPCKLLCDSLGNIKKVNIVTNKGGLKSTLKTVGNSLIFECETDSLKARIKWLEHNQIITEKSHTENTVKIPCELKHRTGFGVGGSGLQSYRSLCLLHPPCTRHYSNATGFPVADEYGEQQTH